MVRAGARFPHPHPPPPPPGGWGMSRMMLSAVTLLPHPDSPTTPSVSPLSMWRLTPSTARITPSSVKKCVFRFVTVSSRSGMCLLEGARDFGEGLERPVDVVAVHVLVGDAPDGRGADLADPHLAGGALPHEHRSTIQPLHKEDDDVGLDPGEIHPEPGEPRDSLAK